MKKNCDNCRYKYPETSNYGGCEMGVIPAQPVGVKFNVVGCLAYRPLTDDTQDPRR